MEEPENDAVQTKVDESSVCASRSEVKIQDRGDLSAKIEEVYQDILESIDATSPSSDIVEASMEDSKAKDGAVQTKVDESSLCASLSKVKIDDPGELLAKIEEVYQDIIRKSTDETDPSSDILEASMEDSKAKELSIRYQKEAEKSWKDDRTEEAFTLIAQSIAFAEIDSPELASAYSTRSHFLLKLARFDCCIQDVDRATRVSYCPTGLRKKLRERKKVCLSVQKNFKTDNKEDHSNWRRPYRFALSSQPQTASKLFVEFNEQLGHHLIALEEIPPGEILSIDNFYAMVLNPFQRYTRCSFCLTKCDTLIPCPTCTLEMYCSENCRISAFESFHKSECKFIRYYERPMNIEVRRIILGLRKFLIRTKHGEILPELMQKLFSRDIFEEKLDRNIELDDYRLSLRIRAIDRVKNIMDFVVPAVETIIVLRRSFFFGDSNTLPDHLGTEESYAALLLVNHFVKISTENAIPILKPYDQFHDTELKTLIKFECETIGFGVCLLQSTLLKRSCDANTSSFIQNRQQIVFATRKIQPGEKITISSPMYKSAWWTSKKRALGVKFICENEDCSKNCPIIESLINEPILFSSSLGLEMEVKKLMVKTKVAALRAKKENRRLSSKEILDLLIDHSMMLCEILTSPSHDIVVCEQLLLLFMRVSYCDHHRQYQDFGLDSLFHTQMDMFTTRVYEPYLRILTKIKNNETLNNC